MMEKKFVSNRDLYSDSFEPPKLRCVPSGCKVPALTVRANSYSIRANLGLVKRRRKPYELKRPIFHTIANTFLPPVCYHHLY